MTQPPPRSSRFYRQIGSKGWRQSGYFTFSVSSSALRNWIASQLPEKRTKILSVGCGTGELEVQLSELKHHVVSLDMSQQMLARARHGGLKLLVLADSQCLPFGDNSFDVVMFMECVGHLRMQTAFEEAGRVLRKRGRILITTYSSELKVHAAYANVRLDEIASSLAAAGFRVKEHRFLNAKRTSIVEAPSENTSNLLYVVSTKQGGVAK